MPRNILLDIFCLFNDITKDIIDYFVSAFCDVIVFLLGTCPSVSGCYCYSVSVVNDIVDAVSVNLDRVTGDNFLTITSDYTYEFAEHSCFDISAGDILCIFSNIDIVCHTNTSLVFGRDLNKTCFLFFSHINNIYMKN